MQAMLEPSQKCIKERGAETNRNSPRGIGAARIRWVASFRILQPALLPGRPRDGPKLVGGYRPARRKLGERGEQETREGVGERARATAPRRRGEQNGLRRQRLACRDEVVHGPRILERAQLGR